MEHRHQQSWVESLVAATTASWNACAASLSPPTPRYSLQEQRNREDAYDVALHAVEREAKHVRGLASERIEAQRRILAVFPRFASIALGLEDEAIQMLTDNFLPVGTQFAQWAKRFDPALSMAGTIQACRNAWTVCGLQPLLGDRMEVTPAIIGYSLLYPYSDNFLDNEGISSIRKLEFSRRFRDRLCGPHIAPRDHHEAAVWAMVRLIEEQFPRYRYPRVYECLLAIHKAQENSIAQSTPGATVPEAELLQLSCAKGGTSVLADACLSHGFLNEAQTRFAFHWGVLLQLGDDLQDIQDDLQHGSATLFTRSITARVPLDNLVRRLLRFSERIADQAELLPHGAPELKRLLRMSWRSLIVMAVARSHQFFSPSFLAELEPVSPFGFSFLRARNKRLSGRRGLYRVVFDSFLETADADLSRLPSPEEWRTTSALFETPHGLPLLAHSLA